MSKKLLFAALFALVPVAILVSVGSGVASGHPNNPPVTFTGAVSCNLQGTLSITPAALQGSGSPSYTLMFKGTNNHCVGLPYQTASTGTWTTTPLVQGGETLKKSKESFTVTVSLPGAVINLCNDLEFGGASLAVTPFAAAITWIGTSPITPTQVSFPAGSSLTIPVPGVIALMNGTTAGSFAGTVDISLGYNVAKVFAGCATAAGLSTLPINHLGGDNLLVGQGY